MCHLHSNFTKPSKKWHHRICQETETQILKIAPMLVLIYFAIFLVKRQDLETPAFWFCRIKIVCRHTCWRAPHRTRSSFRSYYLVVAPKIGLANILDYSIISIAYEFKSMIINITLNFSQDYHSQDFQPHSSVSYH